MRILLLNKFLMSIFCWNAHGMGYLTRPLVPEDPKEVPGSAFTPPKEATVHTVKWP